jgi:hypothetical protein
LTYASSNEHLLRNVTTRKIHSSLLPYMVWRTFEVAVGAAATALSGMVLSRHLDDWLYVTVAGSVLMFAILMTATTIALMVRAMQLDHGEQVSDVQKRVATLKLAEFRAFKWALFGGVVLWLPALLVVIEALTATVSGANSGLEHSHTNGTQLLRQVPLPWLFANMAFGLAVLALGHLWAKKHVDTKLRSPGGQRLLDYASGRQLASISRDLDELSAFSREGSAR